MELKFIELDTTMLTQVRKVGEEVEEFVKAIANKDKENTIEEFWDVVQSMLGAIDIVGISVEEVVTGLDVHYCKLKGRGHKFK